MTRSKGLLSWLPIVAVGGLLVAGVGGYRLMNGKCPLTGCDLCGDKPAVAATVADEHADGHGGCCPLSAGADATLVADHAAAEGQCPHSASECTMSKEECTATCEEACKKACEESGEQAQASDAEAEKPAEPIGG